MKVAFVGTSSILDKDNIKKQLSNTLFSLNSNSLIFYLGDYGGFDQIAKKACLKYKNEHPNSLLYFVTPYIDENYLRLRDPLKNGYDKIIYPELEKTPKRFAILERNKWMVKNADLIIAYVPYNFGGAYTTIKYAERHHKKIFFLK